MRRKHLVNALNVLLCLLLLSSFNDVQAQNAPPYWAVYYVNGSARVVGFDQTNVWTVRDIPHVVVDTYLQSNFEMPITPSWSPDGQTLYLTIKTGSGADQRIELDAFSPATNSLRSLISTAPGPATYNGFDPATNLPVPGTLPGCHTFESTGRVWTKTLTILSISPDGRYALLCSGRDSGNSILDLQTGKIVLQDGGAAEGDCSSSVYAWLLAQHRILIEKVCGMMTATSQLMVVDTNTWTTLATRTYVSDKNTNGDNIGEVYNSWFWEEALLVSGTEPYILGTVEAKNSDSSIVRVHPQSGLVDFLFKGSQPALASNSLLASFIDPKGHLMRLDLTTMKAQDTGLLTSLTQNTYVESNCSPYPPDPGSAQDVINYKCGVTDDNPAPSFITLTTSTVSRYSIPIGDSRDTVEPSRRGSYWAIYKDKSRSIELHNRAGFDWSTQSAFPNSQFVASSSPSRGHWHGSWFIADLLPANATQPYEMAVNVETGESFLAPQPRLHQVSMSPDASLVIYLDTNERLYAYNRKTQTLTLLTQGVEFSFSSVGRWGPAEYYYWSKSAY